MGLIYMYRNKLNDKKYIGQTSRSLNARHWQHLHSDYYIDRALKKYGVENFELIILEDNIPNEQLNEKEMYYIEKYDSYINGYNLTIGGLGTRKITDKTVKEIKELLKCSKLTEYEISRKLNVSVYMVSDINTGICYFDSCEEYPIRKRNSNWKFDDNDCNMVVSYLKRTEYTFNKIADITGTSFDFVYDINRGKRNVPNYENIQFPIRKAKPRINITEELAILVVESLKNSDFSAKEIGEKFQIPEYTVGQINRGKASICRKIDEDFPIRKTQHKNRESAQNICAKITKNQLLEIIDLLINTTVSFEEIATRYNLTKYSIERINTGTTWKNFTSKYKLPIRQNQKINSNLQS